MDVIVETVESEWAGIEIKLGHNKVEEGAANLKAVADKVTSAGGQEPAFLAVVEGLGDYAHKRDDGILVLPICTLNA